MKPKSTLFFILFFLRQQFVQFWIEQQEEKSQQGSASSRLGWIFSADGNSQSSREVKVKSPLAMYSEGALARSPQKVNRMFC